MVLLQVFVHGYSTSWSTYYLPIIIMFSLEGLVMIPWSLRFSLRELACGWYGRVWKPVGVLVGHYITVIVLLGLVADVIPVPFGSKTGTTAALFIMACFCSSLGSVFPKLRALQYMLPHRVFWSTVALTHTQITTQKFVLVQRSTSYCCAARMSTHTMI